VNAAVRSADADADAMPAFTDLGWDSDDRDDTWLVSYADIISTVLAMMVLLFGHRSLVAEQALAAAPVAALAAAGVAQAAADPIAGTSGVAAAAAGSDDGADAAMLARAVAAAQAMDDAESHDALAASEVSAAGEPLTAPSPGERLAALVGARFSGRIAAERRDAGIVLTIPAVALFDSARADLSAGALPLLEELAATLREVGGAQISVEGHTDDRPVQGGAFRSNWDLAAARANAVTGYLLAHGFAPDQLHSVSYADTRPVADNGTPQGRAANRRVELAIDFDAKPR
jgi:chemotaxis protein MotB